MASSAVNLAQIDKQVEIRWEIGELNMGVRLLKLSWDQDTSSKSQLPLEESSLLEVCNASFCEDEDDESQTSSVPLNPDYNRLPPPLELAECSHEQSSCDVTTPIYRNGLVFELKGENSLDIRPQL
ncbi:hypothetical protein JZ751_024649 [Albula glossodonta]|uniref:Uncharacterized protein n=1 Tax=Albula glossodonta TaxID=121402 RepID=A0A8T2PF71_9TELE|nr:hypothetical protein JZ751_024649 [Albula glossodonta]